MLLDSLSKAVDSTVNQRHKFKTKKLLLLSQTSAKKYVWASVWKNPHLLLYLCVCVYVCVCVLCVCVCVCVCLKKQANNLSSYQVQFFYWWFCLDSVHYLLQKKNSAVSLTSHSDFWEVLEFRNRAKSIWMKCL